MLAAYRVAYVSFRDRCVESIRGAKERYSHRAELIRARRSGSSIEKGQGRPNLANNRHVTVSWLEDRLGAVVDSCAGLTG